MSSFHNIKEIEITAIESKVMVSGSELICLT